eukprot:maker-scaffold_9-snap-gene-2.64-mRNA-1 protein AED:0.43 eAED:0.87 QI:0/0/0/1/0/0/2/0/62
MQYNKEKTSLWFYNGIYQYSYIKSLGSRKRFGEYLGFIQLLLSRKPPVSEENLNVSIVSSLT